MKHLFENIDWKEDWEEEEPIDNKKFIMYRIYSTHSLCYLMKKSYIGYSEDDQVWDVDNRYNRIKCYIRFHKIEEGLWRYATNDEIDKYLNKNKLDYLFIK